MLILSYIICLTAPAKVRKTFGFPNSRARSHKTNHPITYKHVCPDLFYAHFCLRVHYTIQILQFKKMKNLIMKQPLEINGEDSHARHFFKDLH